jgi:hypothetical protein
MERIQIPALERIGLALLAEQKGQTESQLIADMIRREVRRELAGADGGAGSPAPNASTASTSPGTGKRDGVPGS